LLIEQRNREVTNCFVARGELADSKTARTGSTPVQSATISKGNYSAVVSQDIATEPFVYAVRGIVGRPVLGLGNLHKYKNKGELIWPRLN